MIRVGNGYDVHPPGDGSGSMVLGGVRFDEEPALAGHSDADVIAHACTDAILGAAGLGDIGGLFPDTDERWRGADSVELLREAARRVADAGFVVGNVDCVVVCDRPRIAPARERMERRLSDAVGAPVSVKGKRTEGVGALGRGEGVAAWAVAVVSGDDDR